MVVPGRLITILISVHRFNVDHTKHGAITEEEKQEEEGCREERRGHVVVNASSCRLPLLNPDSYSH